MYIGISLAEMHVHIHHVVPVHAPVLVYVGGEDQKLSDVLAGLVSKVFYYLFHVVDVFLRPQAVAVRIHGLRAGPFHQNGHRRDRVLQAEHFRPDRRDLALEDRDVVNVHFAVAVHIHGLYSSAVDYFPADETAYKVADSAYLLFLEVPVPVKVNRFLHYHRVFQVFPVPVVYGAGHVDIAHLDHITGDAYREIQYAFFYSFPVFAVDLAVLVDVDVISDGVSGHLVVFFRQRPVEVHVVLYEILRCQDFALFHPLLDVREKGDVRVRENGIAVDVVLVHVDHGVCQVGIAGIIDERHHPAYLGEVGAIDPAVLVQVGPGEIVRLDDGTRVGIRFTDSAEYALEYRQADRRDPFLVILGELERFHVPRIDRAVLVDVRPLVPGIREIYPQLVLYEIKEFHVAVVKDPVAVYIDHVLQ